MRVEEYFSDAQSWDSGYEGHGGKDLLTRIANRLFRRRLLQDRLANTVELCKPLKGMSVLDVACGSGRISFALAHAGAAKVTGYDINENMISLACERLTRDPEFQKVRFLVGDIQNPPCGADVAVLVGILSYLPDVRPALSPLIALRPRTFVLQYLPKQWHGWRKSLIPLGSQLWGKIRRLAIYRHDRYEIDRFMEKNGYQVTRFLLDGNGILIRYDAVP